MQYWMKSEKKGRQKGPKKGHCERFGFQLHFSALFRSLSLFHAVWVLLSFLKGRIVPQMFKKDWGEIFWI
jgi:hypothetical protein